MQSAELIYRFPIADGVSVLSVSSSPFVRSYRSSSVPAVIIQQEGIC